MFEHRNQPPITRAEFHKRVLRRLALALGFVGAALGAGMLGYHVFGGLEWVDSLLDASMILGGMGPVHELNSDGAKVFASFYALFSGLAFIGIAGFLLAPFLHRMMHRFHSDEESWPD